MLPRELQIRRGPESSYVDIASRLEFGANPIAASIPLSSQTVPSNPSISTSTTAAIPAAFIPKPEAIADPAVATEYYADPANTAATYDYTNDPNYYAQATTAYAAGVYDPSAQPYPPYEEPAFDPDALSFHAGLPKARPTSADEQLAANLLAQDYSQMGTFNSRTGRFQAKKRAWDDPAGRQIAHYFDENQWQEANKLKKAKVKITKGQLKKFKEKKKKKKIPDYLLGD